MSKLRLFLFVLFSAILGSFLGMFLSRFFIAKSDGFAGAAMVLGYGIFGFMGGIILALSFKGRLGPQKIKTLNIYLGIVATAVIVWLVVLFNTNRSSDPVEPINRKPTISVDTIR